jgi:5-deoxy-D-glucuronate isomerase
MIRSGYHRVVVAPGYELHFFWAIAGDARQMAAWLDLDHAWIE